MHEGLPVATSADSVGEVVYALDQIASMLPDGHELFTAVYDRENQASDLLIRDGAGATSVLLGLAGPAQEQLTDLLAGLRHSIEELRPLPGIPSFRDVPTVPAEPPVPELEEPPGPDWRTIVEGCPVALIVVATGGTIEYASPAVVPALGVGELIRLEGLPFAEFLHPGDRDRYSRVTELSWHRSGPAAMTVRLRRPDGAYLATELSLRASASPKRLILALQPPGNGRHGIEEVLVHERRQRALAGAADCGVALVNIGGEGLGTVVDLNPEFARLFDTTMGQLVGTQMWELVHSTDAERVRQALQQIADDSGPRLLEVQLADERARRASMLIRVDRSSGSPPALLSVVLRDLSEQHGNLAELQRTVERLEKDNEQLAEFARVSAHDLMAPLRALSARIDLLSPGVDVGSEDALLAVRSAVGRMLATVHGAVAFADAQVQELARAAIELNGVVDHVLVSLGTDITGLGAEIAVSELPTVSGDEAQLERLFISLLTNALRYSGDRPPRVRISAQQEGVMWQIAVADEGIGVQPSARESIFRLFARRTEAPSRAGAGRGIGLATARQIVELHGGRIWVEPNPPGGSVFTFTLPGT